MGKTRGQEYLEKFADQPIRFTPYALKKTGLVQSQVESILRETALPIPPGGTVVVHDAGTGFDVIGWDAGTPGNPMDAVGSGLVQADAAVAAASQ